MYLKSFKLSMVKGHIVPKYLHHLGKGNFSNSPFSPSHSPGDDLGLSGSIIIFPLLVFAKRLPIYFKCCYGACPFTNCFSFTATRVMYLNTLYLFFKVPILKLPIIVCTTYIFKYEDFGIYY